MAELKLAPPTTTFDDRSRITYWYGNTEVRLMYNGSPAHTWGDALIYLPQYKILWAGDVAFFYVAPAAQSGHISKWIESIDRVNKMDVDVIVPGHGPIGSKKELAETGEYLAILKAEATRRYDMKMSPGKAAAEIEDKLGKYGTWADPAAGRTGFLPLALTVLRAADAVLALGRALGLDLRTGFAGFVAMVVLIC